MQQEAIIQSLVVTYVKTNYPKVIFTCAPGNASNPFRGRKNKQMGYCKGWPDLFFAMPNKNYYGLFIELKTKDGKLDKKTQVPILDELNRLGYKAIACYSYEEAVEKINEYFLEK